MRILYLDVNVWHLNPTANYLSVLVKEQFPDTVFYGPGFSGVAELAMGLEAFVGAAGPFDAVVIGPNVPVLVEDDQLAGTVRYIKRYTANRLSYGQVDAFFKDVRGSIDKMDIPTKILSVLNVDYYAASQAQVDRVDKHGFILLGPNIQFVLHQEELTDLARREKHFIRKSDRLSNSWHDFLEQHPERVITAVHFVASNEFCFNALDQRPYDVSVPGVEYVLRREAVRKLAGSVYKKAPKRFFHAYRLFNKIGFPVFSNPVSLRLYNLLFQKSLADTRCVYTARGGFGIPIRKFFEIPAAGALMLCSPPNGFADLGYRAGEHYIDVNPEDLLDAVQAWLVDPKGQSVAKTGQKLTLEQHSLRARGGQIESCLQALQDGTFQGARWEQGQYIVDRKEPACAG